MSIVGAFLLPMALLVPHALTALYVAANDMSGRWDRYRLCRGGPQGDARASLYWRYTARWPVQFCVIMPAALLWFGNGLYGEARGVLHELVLVGIAWNLMQLWLAIVHAMLHHPRLYRFVHKMHHMPVSQMVATAAWYSSVAEFVAMELGSLLVPVWLGMRWPAVAVIYAAIGVLGTVNHSGFTLGWAWDCGYHYTHHLHLRCNYAEWEWLDRLFGTYKS